MEEDYQIQFDFDCPDDPPTVQVINSSGAVALEVYEEPRRNPETLEWEPGEFATFVVDSLNGYTKWSLDSEEYRQVAALVCDDLDMLVEAIPLCKTKEDLVAQIKYTQAMKNEAIENPKARETRFKAMCKLSSFAYRRKVG